MGFFNNTLALKVYLLVVLAIVAMVSIVIVFHKNFEDINVRYTEKVKELNDTFENLAGTQTKLNKTLSEIELKNIKEADLKDKYNELKDERNSLETEVNRLNGVIVDKDQKIQSLNSKVAFLESDIEKLNSKIKKLNNRVSCFEKASPNAGC